MRVWWCPCTHAITRKPRRHGPASALLTAAQLHPAAVDVVPHPRSRTPLRHSAWFPPRRDTQSLQLSSQARSAGFNFLMMGSLIPLRTRHVEDALSSRSTATAAGPRRWYGARAVATTPPRPPTQRLRHAAVSRKNAHVNVIMFRHMSISTPPRLCAARNELKTSQLSP